MVNFVKLAATAKRLIEANGRDVTLYRRERTPAVASEPWRGPAASVVTAGSFVVGARYEIVSIGTTDFTLIGAASNTIGVQFVATGVGSGTGTANLAPTSLGPVKVAFLPASGSGFGQFFAALPDELTQRIDQVGLLAADSVAALSPAPAELDVEKYDTVDDSGKVLLIVSVQKLQPATQTLLYALGLNG